MAEVAFAKQFLSSFDSRPQKISSDHVADARSLPAQPAFILPRMDRPFTKATDSQAADAAGPAANGAATLKLTLAPLRTTPGSPAPVTLDVASKTSIYDIKRQVGLRTGYLPEKLKLLWERKPISDSKTVAEATGSQSGSIDMAVMYTGSPSNPPQSEASGPPSEDAQAAKQAEAEKMDVDAPASSHKSPGYAEIESAEFWDDLQGYLTQRLRDDKVAKEAVVLWKRSWKSR